MKIQTGFVSNSSTSSFIIYGIPMTREEIIEIFEPTSMMKCDDGEKEESWYPRELANEAGWDCEEEYEDSEEYFVGSGVLHMSSDSGIKEMSEDKLLTDLQRARTKIEELVKRCKTPKEPNLYCGVNAS